MAGKNIKQIVSSSKTNFWTLTTSWTIKPKYYGLTPSKNTLETIGLVLAEFTLGLGWSTTSFSPGWKGLSLESVGSLSWYGERSEILKVAETP